MDVRLVRQRALTAALLALFLLLGTTRAEADMYKNALENVKQALKADDDAALARYAKHYAMHAWPVAVDLCQEGRFDDALRFARAAQGKMNEHFTAYVESCKAWTGDWAALTKTRADLRAAIIACVDPKTAVEGIKQLEELEVPPDAPGTVEARRRFAIAFAYQRLSRQAECAKASLPAIEAAQAIGWHYGEIVATQYAHGSRIYMQWVERALVYARRLLTLAHAYQDADAQASAEYGVGNLLIQLERFDEGLPYLERSIRMFQAAGNVEQDQAARALLLQTLLVQGEIERSLQLARQLVADMEPELAHANAVETVLALGQAYQRLGRYEEARAANDRATALAHERKDPMQIAITLLARAGLHRLLGDAAAALNDLEAATTPALHSRSASLVKKVRISLAALHHMLGNRGETDKHLKVAVFWQRFLKDPTGDAAILAIRARIADDRGEHAQARALLLEALATNRKVGNLQGIAKDLGTLGEMDLRAGNHDEAVKHLTEAHDRTREFGDQVGLANANLALGRALVAAGRGEEAGPILEAASRKADALGVIDVQIGAAMTVAQRLMQAKQAKQALVRARTAIELLPRLVQGHGEEEGIRARTTWAPLYDVGLRAAVEAGTPADVHWMLESGRAGALRESFAAQEAMQRALLPADVAAAEGLARHRVLRAREAMRQAARSEGRPARKQALERVIAAHRALQQVIERAQRTGKAGARLRYPQPDDLETTQAHLRPGESLVTYALSDAYSVALVVSRKDARVVRLAPQPTIEAALEAVDLEAARAVPAGAIAELQKLLAAPLGLDPGASRLLVSPEGPLAYFPFSLLFPEREVAYTSSGTTYGLLLAGRAIRGEKTLAVGDPDYTAPPNASAARSIRAGRWSELSELPATRAEVEAVGDLKLLRGDATIASFQAAARTQERWRSVHFACHGLIDETYPLFSALALTPGEADDGWLTCLDVFRMQIPADLIVLSACRTATGRSYESEGLVGFTRAFMYAGTPRVLCSLWDVDDTATTALMVKFYELWRPRSGKPGMPAAAALKQAQAFVRRQEKWEHPRYWSAWVLWGLAE